MPLRRSRLRPENKINCDPGFPARHVPVGVCAEEKVLEVKKLEKAGKVTKPAAKKSLVCTICGKPTVRLVDGEPSCDDHAALVYENQIEDYTRQHLSDRDEHKV